MLESELFGYEKGAFTGAVARRIGKFEEANGGTLLLDEISEMDIRLQAKLLRAIQEKEIDRIGGKTPIKVDVRILATSNRNMIEEVKGKTFREDLYYRLNVVNVAIPSLRERRGDILPLAEYFIKKYTELNDVPLKDLTKASANKLFNYSYPGNVRELENIIHRAVLISVDNDINEDAIILGEGSSCENNQENVQNDGVKSAFKPKKMSDVERDLIIDTLKYTLGNRTHTANILGISIRTLRNKIKQYLDEGIEVPKPTCGEE
ncbi:MAG: Transcriptional regulatory protein ZraR [Alphaproteobacteria bacterium ADurb.Bin438]|nr:MAG: Transcriptional regulatory protein ZraR [Alphaproteobacteria bacterium ADurb.Bin438]